MTVEPELARIGEVDFGEQTGDGGFSTSGMAHQRDRFSGLCEQMNVTQDGTTRFVREAEVAHLHPHARDASETLRTVRCGVWFRERNRIRRIPPRGLRIEQSKDTFSANHGSEGRGVLVSDVLYWLEKERREE